MIQRHMVFLGVILGACTSSDDKPADKVGDTATEPGDPPATYAFDSRFEDGTSVSYGGQVMRHLLITDLDAHLGGLTARLDTGAFFPVAGEVAGELDFYLSFDSTTSGGVALAYETDPPALQSVWDDVSTDKDLVGKIAGNDPVGQHQDWATAFSGWDQAGVTTPESLVRTWFAEIDAAAVARSNGDVPVGPDGVPLPLVHLTADGLDRQELLQKFLLGAVAFSQGADDYLDDDVPGSGLLSSNAAAEEGEPYTALEHAWDEGFGYFGASRDYGATPDEVLADPTWADTLPDDGAVDLLVEATFGHAQNAAKRDLGAVSATDLSGDAWEAFVAGRHLIATTQGDLSEAKLDELRGHRDRALTAWELALAATMVHYVNDVLEAMDAIDTPAYSFPEHAKAWSELKGFALSPQFSPHSPMTDAEFEQLHAWIGMHPVLQGARAGELDTYRAALLDARALLGDVYGIDAANLGDENGQNGW